MLYRKMGKTNEEVSLLGFGAMRLPTAEDGSIDQEMSVAMIRKAIDNGVNYIDTAFTYPKSEKIIGEALKDGYREKVFIADKIPPWLIRSEEDKESLFNKSFERLGVDVIDFFLLHNLNAPIWKKALKNDLLSFLAEKKKEGKIRYIGFSFHDSLDLFKEIVDAFDWDMCQIQLNFMDKDFQAGEEGLKYAADKGIGVVIMEPLKGGRLTQTVPPAIEEIWEKDESDTTPVQWAFKWVASHPEVSVILSGMSDMEQLGDNLWNFSDPAIEEISGTGRNLLEEVSTKYKELIRYDCTSCGYCMPCPQKIEIPRVIGYYNDWRAFGEAGNIMFEYSNWLGRHASDCVECHACEEKCPQHLPIAEAMKEAAETMGL